MTRFSPDLALLHLHCFTRCVPIDLEPWRQFGSLAILPNLSYKVLVPLKFTAMEIWYVSYIRHAILFHFLTHKLLSCMLASLIRIHEILVRALSLSLLLTHKLLFHPLLLTASSLYWKINSRNKISPFCLVGLSQRCFLFHEILFLFLEKLLHGKGLLYRHDLSSNTRIHLFLTKTLLPPFQVFSKLAEQRFPSEFELRDLIGSRLPPSPFGKNMGNVLS